MPPIQPNPQDSIAALQRVLTQHAARYPAMEAQDYGKLLFQSAFGPEHLLTDPDQAASWILREKQEAVPGKSPEDIGNGLCRMYLDPAWSAAAADILARLMVRTAAEVRGTREDLEAGIPLLLALDVPGMPAWVAQWRAAGCPAVHHSEAYRQAYHPHYRLLRRCYAAVFSLLLEVSALLLLQQPLVLAIDGRCGSGKTWLASVLQDVFPCRVIHMDDFYLPMEQRNPRWKEIPAGNMDLQRLRSEVLLSARRGEEIPYRAYRCSEGSYLPTELLPAQPLTVVEGSYSLHPSLRDCYHKTAFLSCAPDVQARRLAKREGAHYFAFADTWVPLEEQYIRACAPDQFCTHVINTSAFF